MTESTKTISMVIAAAAVLAVAFIARPKPPYAPPEGEAGQLLFTDWKDPAAAKSLEIVGYDEGTASLRNFKVAEVDGKWSIPAHGSYPADAKDHVFKAASDLINLKILDIVSVLPGEHEKYGVVEPDQKKLSQGAAGIGKLVVVQDEAGKDLARLIIGLPDKSPSGSGAGNLRFVRRAGQDRVYRVSLATDIFSTNFQDWVDTDFLTLKQHWDISHLNVRDYALNVTDTGYVLDRKNDLALNEIDQPPPAHWVIGKLTDYDKNDPKEAKPAAGEEVDATKLNDYKMNLSGMRLVDVARKPDGLITKLKAGKDFLDAADAEQSLAEHGFFVAADAKPKELFSAGGDVTIGMKDGLEYVVRFGESKLERKAEQKEKDGAAKTKDNKATEQQRWVFVTAHFNEDLLTKPVLEPLPAAKKPDEPKPGDKKPDETKKPDEKGSDKKSDDKKSDDKKSADKKADEKKDEGKKIEGKNSDAKKADEKKPDDAKKPADDKPPESNIKKAEEEQALEEERKRIEAVNKEMTDKYNADVKKGKDHAKQLNDRFADWYYRISDEDYKRVRVGRADLIHKKAEAGADHPPLDGVGPGLENPFQSPRGSKK